MTPWKWFFSMLLVSPATRYANHCAQHRLTHMTAWRKGGSRTLDHFAWQERMQLSWSHVLLMSEQFKNSSFNRVRPTRHSTTMAASFYVFGRCEQQTQATVRNFSQVQIFAESPHRPSEEIFAGLIFVPPDPRHLVSTPIYSRRHAQGSLEYIGQRAILVSFQLSLALLC